MPWEILTETVVSSLREGPVTLSLGCPLHYALMAGSESGAELSNAITSLVPQARKPEVIFNTHSSKPLPKANHHAMLAAPTHCDVSLISIFLFLQPVLNDLPLLQSGLS